MDVELLISLAILVSIIGSIICLRPRKSDFSNRRRTTSHRNGYGRDYDYR